MAIQPTSSRADVHTGDGSPWDIVSGVGLTALAVAAARAIETTSDHALFDDPYATAFVRAADPPQPLPSSVAEITDPLWAEMTDYMALRTRFIDDLLAANQPSQVVILAAGLDSRAYRLDWPEDCVLFEIDQATVLEFKQQVLDGADAEPTCARHVVPVDLRDDWGSALVEAGFDPGSPAAWLAEGLLPYLPAKAEEALFDRLHGLSWPGSTVTVEAMGPRSLSDIVAHPMMDRADQGLGVDFRSLWQSEPRRDCAAWLDWAGWATEAHPVTALQDRYGRRLSPDVEELMGANTFVTARRS